MIRKKWKRMIPVVCAAVVLLGALAGTWLWREFSFRTEPFGYQYSVVSVFFTDGDVPPYEPEIPKYALTDTGMLLDIHGSDFGRLSGSFRKFQLSQDNFDDCFLPDGAWRVTGIDAVSARENNAQAWQYQNISGSFYYIMLQKNGDVFLCIGEKGAICQFFWMQPLGQY